MIYFDVCKSDSGHFRLHGIAPSTPGEIEVVARDLGGLVLESFGEFDLSSLQVFSFESKITYRNDIVVEVRDEKTTSTMRYAKRKLDLSGAYNFRDFGGYSTDGGAQVPWRKYFRSENLSSLTANDIQVLGSVGISTIFDLRQPLERLQNPTPEPIASSINIVEVPLLSTIVGYEDGLAAIFAGKIPRITASDMAQMYAELLEVHINEMMAVAQAILDHDNGSILIHCNAGKDRTGMIVALVQLALGVSTDDVIYDYLLSNRYRTPVRMAQLKTDFQSRGLSIDNFKPYMSAPYLAFLAVLEDLESASKEIRK